MKIISKYKDYYDYLQGVYGIDEKLVLDRSKFTKTLTLYNTDTIRIYFCDYVVEGMFYDGEILYGKELERFKDKKTKYNYYFNPEFVYKYHSFSLLNNDIVIRKEPYKSELSPNTVNNCPIIITKYWDYTSEEELLFYPILKDYNFSKVFTAEQAFLMLSEWLGKEKVIENNQTDKEKILSAGFDLKTSFRKM